MMSSDTIRIFGRQNLHSKTSQRQARKVRAGQAERVLFLLGPLVALCAVETLNEKCPVSNLDPVEFSMNLAFYAIVWALLWLLFGRKTCAATVGMVSLTIFGTVNHYVLRYMGRILFPNDLAGTQTAVNVMGKYSFAPDGYVVGAWAIVLIYLLLLFRFRKKQGRQYFHRRWMTWGIGLISGAYLIAFYFSPWLPAAGIKTQQWDTQCNGFLLNFNIALRYSRVEKPAGYSLEEVRDLTDQLLETEGGTQMTLWKDPYMSSTYDVTTQDEEGAQMEPSVTITNDPDGTQPVNILCIMNESLADLSVYDAMTTSEDTLPFYHSLKENTIKGWMYSPVTGGGTATVEYEFLTGNSVSFLPIGTVAYQLYVKEHMPSLISWGNGLGFESTTFHPYESSGWNRTIVYEDFEADHQLYEEDVINPSYVRKYISDSCDYQQLRHITSEAAGEKTFVFNVTMQNHGGYAQGWNNLPRTTTLTGALAGTSSQTEQYISLMRESDRSLEELISYYSQVEEPTLIVLFGDHQGNLSSTFYQRLYGKSLSDRTMEEIERQYVTPFLIWANYDIDEATDVMISTNYLGALTAMVSNYPLTGYQRFLAQLYQQVPVINRTGYISKEGVVTASLEDLTPEEQEWIERYSMLSYYNLFQRDDAIDQAFFRGDGT